jgi:anti-sigma B factor antagonist
MEGASGSTIVVHFTGCKVSLDEELLYCIRDQLVAMVNEPSTSDVVFDFGNVEYLTSMALAMLVSLRKKLCARGRHMTVANLSPQVHEIFAATRLDKLLDLRLAARESQATAENGQGRFQKGSNGGQRP